MFIRTFLLFLLDVPKSIILMDDYIMRYNKVQNLDLGWKVLKAGSLLGFKVCVAFVVSLWRSWWWFSWFSCEGCGYTFFVKVMGMPYFWRPWIIIEIRIGVWGWYEVVLHKGQRMQKDNNIIVLKEDNLSKHLDERIGCLKMDMRFWTLLCKIMKLERPKMSSIR